MQEQQLYHTSQPESIQTLGYQEYNNIDFILNVGEGRSLVKNSVRITGEIAIQTAEGSRVLIAEQVILGHKIGIHSVVSSCQVSFGTTGLKENIQNYSRFAEMLAVGQLYTDDYLNTSQMCELRTVNNLASELNSLGLVAGIGGETAILTGDKDFSFKPHCVLNRMSGDDLPFSKSGEVRLTINLDRSINVLMGLDQTDTCRYILQNLNCTYRSTPTDTSNSLTVMNSVYNIKSTILSGSANISAQVPAICQAVSISFQEQENENSNGPNNQALNTVENISRVQFLFNDATNQYVTYEISDINEMLHRYIESFRNTGHNQMAGDAFRTNGGFGIGLDFNGSVDLSNQRFAVQLDSDVSAQRPLNAYMYFHSVMSV